MKIIKTRFFPAVGNHIQGYGDIERIQPFSNGTSASLVKVGDETILIDSYSLSNIRKSNNKKPTFFTRIKEIPHTGERYEMYRYQTDGLVSEWNQEHVLSAPLIGVKKLWHNLFYAESDYSAYFIYIG